MAECAVARDRARRTRCGVEGAGGTIGYRGPCSFLGDAAGCAEALVRVDVFVLPSLSEGLSLALLEAMASGKPVVATRVGGNPELIDHGRTGFLIQPEDGKDLAAHLLNLLSDPEMMQQFGRQASERVQQHFSMGQMVDRYRDLYARSCTVYNSGMNRQ